MKTKQAGFTLIELIAVIVILGILAAIAIPKYASLESSARTASINGLAGAVNGAMSLAHSLALAQSKTGATGSITMEGTTVALAYSYPDTSTTGIQAAVNFSTTSYTAGTAAGATQTFTISGYSGANCLVTYTKATASAIATVTTTTSGC